MVTNQVETLHPYDHHLDRQAPVMYASFRSMVDIMVSRIDVEKNSIE
jgi:hypothetical protein